MAIQIQWVGLAEGSAMDSRQAITLVGFNQVIVVPNSLPHQWQTQIIVIANEDEENETKLIRGHVIINIKDPEGDIVGSTSSFIDSAPRKFPDVPSTMLMAVFVGLELKDYGRYTVEATARESLEGPDLSKFVQPFYVVDNSKESDQ